jgi:hypothetical protein
MKVRDGMFHWTLKQMCKPKKKEEPKPCPNCKDDGKVTRSNYGATMYCRTCQFLWGKEY